MVLHNKMKTSRHFVHSSHTVSVRVVVERKFLDELGGINNDQESN